jgi:hypothetical protein
MNENAEIHSRMDAIKTMSARAAADEAIRSADEHGIGIIRKTAEGFYVSEDPDGYVKLNLQDGSIDFTLKRDMMDCDLDPVRVDLVSDGKPVNDIFDCGDPKLPVISISGVKDWSVGYGTDEKFKTVTTMTDEIRRNAVEIIANMKEGNISYVVKAPEGRVIGARVV